MQQLNIFDQSTDTQEKLELLDYILSNLEVEHFKGKFGKWKDKDQNLIRFKDEKVALYDLEGSPNFNKLVQALEERKKSKEWLKH